MSSKDSFLVIEGQEDKAGNSFFRVRTKDRKRGECVKVVSYTQLMELLSRSYRAENITLTVGDIPEGYIDARISSDSSGEVFVYVAPKKRSFLLKVDGQKFPMGFIIPMPAMVFSISFSAKGSVHGDCCVVKGTYEEVKDAYYKGSLQGYLYPFGNVSEDGSICMGSIPVKMTSISEASTYVDAFFDGITNHHYLEEYRVMNGMGQMELLGAINEKDEFPMDWLVAADFDFLKRSKKSA